MPFSLREINLMAEGKMEMINSILENVADLIGSAKAGIMAMLKNCHTGKTVSPNEFYTPIRKPKKPQQMEGVNREAFAIMKSLTKSVWSREESR